MTTNREDLSSSTALTVRLTTAQTARKYAEDWLAHVTEHGKEAPVPFGEAMLRCRAMDFSAWPLAAQYLRDALHPGADAVPGEMGKDGKIKGKRKRIAPGEHARLTIEKYWTIDHRLMKWAQKFKIELVGAIKLEPGEMEIGVIEDTVSRIEDEFTDLSEDDRRFYITSVRQGAQLPGVQQGKLLSLTMLIERLMASAEKANHAAAAANHAAQRHRDELAFEAKARETELQQIAKNRESEQKFFEKSRELDAERIKLLEQGKEQALQSLERERHITDEVMKLLKRMPVKATEGVD